MTVNKKSQAQAVKEQSQLMTFQFSESKSEIRSLMLNGEPWLIAKEICDVLELGNITMALKGLDDDEKLTSTLVKSGQNRKTWLVSESGMYALIMRSNKPQAKTFRKWVTSEVLPTIRKKGYYSMRHQQNNDFIDARDVPYVQVLINEKPVRCIELANTKWFSINDYHTAIGSRTESTSTAKRLNLKKQLATKIWLYGNTHPAWFTNQLGLQLIASGSRIFTANQLKLTL